MDRCLNSIKKTTQDIIICTTAIFELGLLLIVYQICAAPPEFHMSTFTGSDFTSSFVRKGKVKPFTKLLGKKAFHCLATEEEQSQRTENTLQVFTSFIYRAKVDTNTTLNHHRYTCKIFEEGFGPSSTMNLLGKLKEIDASSIPPCEAEIKMHIKQSAFVAQTWANADKTDIRQHRMAGIWLMDTTSTCQYGMKGLKCQTILFPRRMSY